MLRLSKVISGGQTGVDTSALIAAKECGLKTGGWMPKGFRTLAGNKPQFADLYGMKASSAYSYGARTMQNVEDSDGTLRIAVNFNSAGEKCTLAALRKCNRPYFDVQLLTSPFRISCGSAVYTNPYWLTTFNDVLLRDIREWLSDNEIRTLNVAGNSEITCCGIQSYVTSYLCDLFKCLSC